MTECKKVSGLGGSVIIGCESFREEECVLVEVVIDVVIDELP
jgi:hypothetical protein